MIQWLATVSANEGEVDKGRSLTHRHDKIPLPITTMKITREDVLRVAELAHLELSEAEIEMFARQLDSILSYSEKLNELDTEGVEPMSQVAAQSDTAGEQSAGTPMREDTPAPCTVIGEVLAGAPDPDPPYFRVPKVIDR